MSGAVAALMLVASARAQPNVEMDRPCTGCLLRRAVGDGDRPLVVVLHGDGQQPAKVLSAWSAHADRAGWSIFAPRCPRELGCDGSWWRWDGHPRWLDEQVERLGDVPIDRERVYLVGWSGGATWIGWRWADLSDRWAAVVIHGGGRAPAMSSCPDRSPPVYFLVGDRNPLHHLAVSLREALDRCNVVTHWDLLRVADHPAEQRALAARGDDVVSWLRDHPRAISATEQPPASVDEPAAPTSSAHAAASPARHEPTMPEPPRARAGGAACGCGVPVDGVNGVARLGALLAGLTTLLARYSKRSGKLRA